ncbi:hypothetical protein Vretifemale_6113 [Volvox reticuliferus]|uniref:Uncharacterized protein n=1 Tax=Volvox reticuliferus TaxID=1737510 RepID=A0A8J4C833_9CHLO|nr:hypothetical protein Vretifemale_6113 [Volvox reticuliferus]
MQEKAAMTTLVYGHIPFHAGFTTVLRGLHKTRPVRVPQLPETRGMPQLDTFQELLEWLSRNDRTILATGPVTETPGQGANAEMSCAVAGGGSDSSKLGVRSAVAGDAAVRGLL